jgi:hypothetical protein
MTEKLCNGDDCPTEMKREWKTIKIDSDIEKILSDNGKFGQSYNDVIKSLIEELEQRRKEKKESR